MTGYIALAHVVLQAEYALIEVPWMMGSKPAWDPEEDALPGDGDGYGYGDGDGHGYGYGYGHGADVVTGAQLCARLAP
jgi:hypothetical protein